MGAGDLTQGLVGHGKKFTDRLLFPDPHKHLKMEE